MNICFLIPARYHSTRLEGKPLLKINNKSIISLVFEQARKSKYSDDIYITTDNDRIINEIGKENCIKVTENCLNGTERICYALNKINKKYDIIVNIQGDEPFIDPTNIDFVIDKFIENINCNEMVCTTIHNKMNKEDVNNRNIGKLVLDKYNNIMYCSRNMIPSNKECIIKDIDYYEHIGVFVFKASYLDEYLKHDNTPCMLSEDIEWLKIIEMGYKIKSFQIPGYHEIGVNTIEDYKYLKQKYENN